MIPFFQYEFTKEMEEQAIKTLRSGRYIGGDQVEAFEEEIRAYYKVDHAIAVGNCSDALYMACEMISSYRVCEVPVYTFVATAEAVVRSGRQLAFKDIDPETMCADSQTVTVNLYGNVIRKSDAYIQDMAQAFGAPLVCPIGCLSFFPTKILGCCGDGGMVITNDSEVADQIRSVRAHGKHGNYDYHRHGINSRLDAVQASILRERLKNVDYEIVARNGIARTYDEMLSQIPQVKIPYSDSVYNCYVIMAEDRDALHMYLLDCGIQSMIYYPKPLNHYPIFNDSRRYPVAEEASAKNLALPIYPTMDNEEVWQVGEAIIEFYKGR